MLILALIITDLTNPNPPALMIKAYEYQYSGQVFFEKKYCQFILIKMKTDSISFFRSNCDRISDFLPIHSALFIL